MHKNTCFTDLSGLPLDSYQAPQPVPLCGVMPKAGELVPVLEGVLWGRLPLPFAVSYVNIFALSGPEGWTLVDSGMRGVGAEKIWEAWLSGPLAQEPVARIIITHHHPDHIGLAGWLHERTGAPICTGRLSWFHAHALIRYAYDAPPEEHERFYIGMGYDKGQMIEWRKRAVENYNKTCAPLPTGFKALLPGQWCHFAGREWTFLEGQGHAADHILPVADDGLIIGGDYLLLESAAAQTIYPTEPESDPLGEFLANAQEILPLLPQDGVVLSGHGACYQYPQAVLLRHLQRIERKLDRLLSKLNEPVSAMESVSLLFKPDYSPAMEGYLCGQAAAFLNHLWHRGVVTRNLDAQGVWRFSPVNASSNHGYL